MNIKKFIISVNQLLIFSILMCSYTVCADTYKFPKGNIPELSLIEASKICQAVVQNSKIKTFNPTSVSLVGSKSPTSGVWDFEQHHKNGDSFRFLIYFPRDLCVIMNNNNGAIISAQKRDGTPADLPVEPLVEKIDPFEE